MNVGREILVGSLIAMISINGCVPTPYGSYEAIPLTAPKLKRVPSDLGKSLISIGETAKSLMKLPGINKKKPGAQDVPVISSYAEFCRVFQERTKKSFVKWQDDSKVAIEDSRRFENDPKLVPPTATDLIAILDQLQAHRERYNPDQLAAIENAKQLLNLYLRILSNPEDPKTPEGEEPGVKELLDSLTLYTLAIRTTIEKVNEVADQLRTNKLVGNDAAPLVQSLFNPESGIVGQSLAMVQKNTDDLSKAAGAVEVKLEEAKAAREQLRVALEALQKLVQDPQIKESVKKLEEQEKSFLEKVADVVKWIHPFYVLFFLLSLIFGGGGGGGGGGGDGNSEQSQNNSNQPGGTEKTPGENNSTNGQSVGTESTLLPKGAETIALRSPEDGPYLITAYTLNGEKWLSIREKKETAAMQVTLRFDLDKYAATEPAFSSLAEALAANTLVVKSAHLTLPYPVIAQFTGLPHPTALRWNDHDLKPQLLGGKPTAVIPIEETIVPIVAPTEGTHTLYLTQKAGQSEMLMRLFEINPQNKKETPVAELSINPVALDLCPAGQEMSMAIEQGVQIGSVGNAYPISLRIKATNGLKKDLLWNEAGKPPTVINGLPGTSK